jgi:hypothetical protein
MQNNLFCNWNEFDVKPLASINWRASLVPAAAVIPAPIAYIKVVAVEKLVVEFLSLRTSSPFLMMNCVFIGNSLV